METIVALALAVSVAAAHPDIDDVDYLLDFSSLLDPSDDQRWGLSAIVESAIKPRLETNRNSSASSMADDTLPLPTPDYNLIRNPVQHETRLHSDMGSGHGCPNDIITSEQTCSLQTTSIHISTTEMRVASQQPTLQSRSEYPDNEVVDNSLESDQQLLLLQVDSYQYFHESAPMACELLKCCHGLDNNNLCKEHHGGVCSSTIRENLFLPERAKLVAVEEFLFSDEANESILDPFKYFIDIPGIPDVTRSSKRVSSSECGPAAKRVTCQALLPSNNCSRASAGCTDVEPHTSIEQQLLAANSPIEHIPETRSVTPSESSSQTVVSSKKKGRKKCHRRLAHRDRPENFEAKASICKLALRHIEQEFGAIHNHAQLMKICQQHKPNRLLQITIGPYSFDLRDKDTLSAARLHCPPLYIIFCVVLSTVTNQDIVLYGLERHRDTSVQPRLRCWNVCAKQNLQRFLSKCKRCLKYLHYQKLCSARQPCYLRVNQCEECRQLLQKYEASLHPLSV